MFLTPNDLPGASTLFVWRYEHYPTGAAFLPSPPLTPEVSSSGVSRALRLNANKLYDAFMRLTRDMALFTSREEVANDRYPFPWPLVSLHTREVTGSILELPCDLIVSNPGYREEVERRLVRLFSGEDVEDDDGERLHGPVAEYLRGDVAARARLGFKSDDPQGRLSVAIGNDGFLRHVMRIAYGRPQTLFLAQTFKNGLRQDVSLAYQLMFERQDGTLEAYPLLARGFCFQEGRLREVVGRHAVVKADYGFRFLVGTEFEITVRQDPLAGYGSLEVRGKRPRDKSHGQVILQHVPFHPGGEAGRFADIMTLMRTTRDPALALVCRRHLDGMFRDFAKIPPASEPWKALMHCLMTERCSMLPYLLEKSREPHLPAEERRLIRDLMAGRSVDGRHMAVALHTWDDETMIMVFHDRTGRDIWGITRRISVTTNSVNDTGLGKTLMRVEECMLMAREQEEAEGLGIVQIVVRRPSEFHSHEDWVVFLKGLLDQYYAKTASLLRLERVTFVVDRGETGPDFYHFIPKFFSGPVDKDGRPIIVFEENKVSRHYADYENFTLDLPRLSSFNLTRDMKFSDTSTHIFEGEARAKEDRRVFGHATIPTAFVERLDGEIAIPHFESGFHRLILALNRKINSYAQGQAPNWNSVFIGISSVLELTANEAVDLIKKFIRKQRSILSNEKLGLREFTFHIPVRDETVAGGHYVLRIVVKHPDALDGDFEVFCISSGRPMPSGFLTCVETDGQMVFIRLAAFQNWLKKGGAIPPGAWIEQDIPVRPLSPGEKEICRQDARVAKEIAEIDAALNLLRQTHVKAAR